MSGRLLAAGALLLALGVLAVVLIGDSGATTVTVSARTEWTDTGVDVDVGDRVTITATGRICDDVTRPDQCYGPDGEPDLDGRHPGDPFDANHAALVAVTQPEDGTVFEIGRHRSFDVAEQGRLLLGVNDDRLDDNTGSFEATIVVAGR